MKAKTKYILTGTILTLICVIGGTFAYFTASKSSEENSVSATAAQLSLGYTDVKSKVKTDLIPTAESVAIKYAEEGVCEDANGYSVCSIYNFTVENTSDVKVAIGAILKPNVNTFENLKYRVYETDTISDANLISETKSLELNNGNDIYIEGIKKELAVGGKVAYTILMWVNETGENQSLTDGGKDFAGKVEVYAYLPGTSSDDHNKPTGGDIVDTNVPTDNEIVLNNGDYQTNKGTVTASLKSTGATEVCLTETNDPASCTNNVEGTYNSNKKIVATPLVNKKEAKVELLTNNTWTSFNEEVTYDLDTTTEGEKTIYAFFKNEAGTSAGVSSKIIYSQDPYLVEEDNAYYYENGKYDENGTVEVSGYTYPGYYDTNLDRFYIDRSAKDRSASGFYENDGNDIGMYYNEKFNDYIYADDTNLYEFNTDLSQYSDYYNEETSRKEDFYDGRVDQDGNTAIYINGTLYKREVSQTYDYYVPYKGVKSNVNQILIEMDRTYYIFTPHHGDMVNYYSEYNDVYYSPMTGQFLRSSNYWREDIYFVCSPYNIDEYYSILDDSTGVEYYQNYNGYKMIYLSNETSDGYLAEGNYIEMYLDYYDEESEMYYSGDSDAYVSKSGEVFKGTEAYSEGEIFYYDEESGMYVSYQSYEYNVLYYDAKGVISQGKFYYKDENGNFVELT